MSIILSNHVNEITNDCPAILDCLAYWIGPEIYAIAPPGNGVFNIIHHRQVMIVDIRLHF
jgi:hypothetical protein